MKKIFLYISALLAGAACSAQETLLSPDGRLRLEFNLADGGRPTYTLDYKERPVILVASLERIQSCSTFQIGNFRSRVSVFRVLFMVLMSV